MLSSSLLHLSLLSWPVVVVVVMLMLQMQLMPTVVVAVVILLLLRRLLDYWMLFWLQESTQSAQTAE